MINERPALVVLQTFSENNMEHLSYNHAQKSWDKFTFVAWRFFTRAKQTVTRELSTPVQPLPHPSPWNVGNVCTLLP